MNRRLFKADLKNESVLAEYLDQYFYPKLKPKFNRIKDLNQQLKGIDIIQYDESGNNVYRRIDEKGYLSRPKIQNTFVLELSYWQDEKLKEGWLYDENKLTTHYLLCWANRKEINIYEEQLKVSDIFLVEAMLVNRKKIAGYLNVKYGINREYITRNINKIINEAKEKAVYLDRSKSKYVFSKQLNEQPLNLVMHREEYYKSVL